MLPHSQKPGNVPGINPISSAKKLPTKATPHIAKEPLPVGAITSKGQKKVVDSQGKIRFIDMKQGRVLGPSGVPVKS